MKSYYSRLLLPIIISVTGIVWLFSAVSIAEAWADGEQLTESNIVQITSVTNGGTVSCSISGDSHSVNCAGTIPAGGDYLRIDLDIEPVAEADWLVRGFALDITATTTTNRIHLNGSTTDIINDGMDWLSPVPSGFTRYCWGRFSVLVGGCSLASGTVGLVDYDAVFSHGRLYIYVGQSASPTTIDLTFTPRWIMLGTPTTEEEPVQTLGIGYSCVVSFTETITNDSGITTTQTITYTVPDANLVNNPSFEELTNVGLDTYPAEWKPVWDGAIDYSMGDFVSSASNSGDYSVYSRVRFELWGDVNRVLPSGSYRGGYYLACGYDLECSGDLVSLSVNSQEISGTHAYNISGTTFSSYSGTVSLGGGSPNVIVNFLTGGAPYTLVDDVFLLPVDASGNISCTAELYPPDEYYTDPIGSIPGPIGGAGAICYQCTTPGSLSQDAVSYWIAWLGCVIRNMFSCSLRVWLLVIGNWISGLINQGLAWIAWVPLTIYQGVDWFNQYVLTAISSISVNVINIGTSTNGWDVLLALVNLIGTVVVALSDILLGIVNFASDLVMLIPNALNAEPRYLTLDGVEYTGSGEIYVVGEGGSNSKAVYLFFMGIQWVDALVFGNETVYMVLFVVMGLATLMTLWWTAQHWSELISL